MTTGNDYQDQGSLDEPTQDVQNTGPVSSGQGTQDTVADAERQADQDAIGGEYAPPGVATPGEQVEEEQSTE